MAAVKITSRARRSLEQLYETLIDPIRGERAMCLLLIGYLAAWSVYGAISKSSQDIHTDMGEIVAWSDAVGLGTPKHPPLAAWLVHAWFSVFPRKDWTYYLLSMVLPTIALWVVWRFSARFLPNEKRVVGIALLTLVPFYSFFAQKFNANSVLTPFWAMTTWWFLRSLESHRTGWAVLAGVGAAAAMMGKYWSIVLLAGLGITALAYSRRDSYFSSPAPYITIAVGSFLFAPHFDWLIAHNFMTFAYAIDQHPATFLTAFQSAVGFLVGSLGYIAAPIVLLLIAARPDVAALKDTLWPPEAERRLVVIAFFLPFILAVLIAVLLQVKIGSTWSIPAMTLLPAVLLSSPLIIVPRSAAVALLALTLTFPLVMIVSSPLIAIVNYRIGVPNFASDYQLLAKAMESKWAQRTGQPLRIVASVGDVVNGLVFYFESVPKTFDLMAPAYTPWIRDRDIRHEGMAMVCPLSALSCLQVLDGYALHYQATATDLVEISRGYLGMAQTPVPYKVVIIPPRPQ